MADGTVLVTGALGQVARQALPWLQERHDVVLTDVRDRPDGEEGPPVHVLDLLADDGSGLRGLMNGVSTVVHMAHRPATGFQRPTPGTSEQLVSSPQALYDSERLNVDLAQAVYQAALETGVRRVVTASSNHASSWYQQLYYQGLRQSVRPEQYPKPASFYGWAKVAYESLGFLYASGVLGRQLESVQVRVVVPRELQLSDYVGRPVAQYLRDVTGYLSPRDCGQLFRRAVETEDIRDEDGVPFLIVYATSGNDRRFWDLESAKRVLGYAPQDNSEVRFMDDIDRIRRLRPDDPVPPTN